MKPYCNLFAFSLFLVGLPLYAQENELQLQPGQVLRVYLDGEVEDFSYLRRNIKYVDFVNDPKLADVQVIATRLVIGSGGRKYYLNFYSGLQRNVSDFKLSFVHEPNDTDDMDRVRFRKTLEIGLLHYLSPTHQIDQVDITYEPSDEEPRKVISPGLDPWNFWVFRLTGTGGWDLEESRKSISLSGSVQADRITDKWLIRNLVSHQQTTRTYVRSDDDIIRSLNVNSSLDTRVVYAISKHWSAGFFGKAIHSTYINTDFGIYFKPAIEYNFFDWKEADHRIFTFSYFIGPAYYNYRDTTFLNRVSDKLLENNLLFGLELVQPWGEVDLTLGYEGYLNDFRNYNLSAEADLSIRIWKGLSVYFELAAESVHNQLYLSKDDVSVEELLLNTRKLPTTYQFAGEVGFRLYFGSIYNNIVNERL
jgi:hypothetical protein